ncbi:hypothetical protein F5887DRAFT_1258748 [Amanita rubescens]|nr:hypothetical protein F5887DRAFT_1258748 [Amanita rubescens]
MYSSDSFDLSAYLAENDTHSPLLQLSFSLHSLPTVSSLDSIPPFPGHSLAHKVHFDTYLSLHQPNHLSASSPRTGDKTHDGIRVLLAGPTAPRLRNMMTETLHIKKWLSGLAPTSTFPIRNISRHGDSTWKAEGSLHTPEEFAEGLRKKRFLRTPANSKQINRGKLNRNALVIERVVRRDNVSFDTSLASISTETLEDDVNPLAEASPKPTFRLNCANPSGTLPTPSLMVSTSDAVFQISLESSSDISADSPVTLAARRGKKTPPHLSLKQGHQDESYPSIPTAFLGTSTEQWPQHGHIMLPGDAHTDLKSMISALQSHRVAEPFLSGSGTKGGTPWLQNKATGNQDSDSDEWAFADAFVSEYGDLSLGSSVGNPTASFIVSSTGISDSETSDADGNESALSLLPETCPSTQRGGQPITPLPQGPALRTSPQEVRGILKGCKNVRFASLPIRQRPDDETEQESWPDSSAPRSVSTRIAEAQHMEGRGVGRASTLSSSGPSRVRSRPPNPFKPVLDQSRMITQATRSGNRSVSSSGGKRKSGAAPAEIIGASSQRHTIAQLPSAASKMQAVPTGRLRRVTDAGRLANKENGKRLSIKPKLDEHAGQRDSSICQPKDAPARKRLQTPLRTILTRFNK